MTRRTAKAPASCETARACLASCKDCNEYTGDAGPRARREAEGPIRVHEEEFRPGDNP